MNIDEKLALLQGLFLQRAAIDDQIKNLIEGAGGGDTLSDETEEEDEPKAKRKATRQVAKRKVGRYGKGNPMPAEVKEQIHTKFAEGASAPDLAEDFGISISTIWKVLKTKPENQTTKHKDVLDYVCKNHHEFKSKLLPGNVMCPYCQTMECHLGTLSGEVNEEET